MGIRVKTTRDWAFYFYSAIFGVVVADIVLLIAFIVAIVNRGYTASGMSGFDRVSVGSMILITLIFLCIVGVNVGYAFLRKHLIKTKGNYVKYENPKDAQARFQGSNGVFFRSDKIKLGMAEIQKRRSIVYSDNLSVTDLKSKLKRHLELNNVKLDEVFLNELIAGIISSRLIVIKGENMQAKQLERALGAFFGYEMITDDRSFGYRSHDDLVFNKQDNSETDFAVGIFQASYRPDAVNLVPMVGCNTSQIDLYFSRFLRYLKAPNYAYAVKLGKAERLQGFDDKIFKGLVTLPPNIWFVAGGRYSQVDLRYLRSATVIDLTKDLSEEINYFDDDKSDEIAINDTPINEGYGEENGNDAQGREVAITAEENFSKDGVTTEQTGEIANATTKQDAPDYEAEDDVQYYNGAVIVNTNHVVSFKNLMDITEDCLKNSSLGLESWKKVDALESYLASANGYEIDNIFFRQLERYSATLCALGLSESEVLDMCIANRILPTLAEGDPALYVKEENGLAEFIVKLLGEGNCTNSLRALKAMKLA